MVSGQTLSCYLAISILGFDYLKLVSTAGVLVNNEPALMGLSWPE